MEEATHEEYAALLASQLAEQREALQGVEAALSADPSNSELLAVAQLLREAIAEMADSAAQLAAEAAALASPSAAMPAVPSSHGIAPGPESRGGDAKQACGQDEGTSGECSDEPCSGESEGERTACSSSDDDAEMDVGLDSDGDFDPGEDGRHDGLGLGSVLDHAQAAAAGAQTDTAHFASFEAHSRGIASKLMASMGYVAGKKACVNVFALHVLAPCKLEMCNVMLGVPLHCSPSLAVHRCRRSGTL